MFPDNLKRSIDDDTIPTNAKRYRGVEDSNDLTYKDSFQTIGTLCYGNGTVADTSGILRGVDPLLGAGMVYEPGSDVLMQMAPMPNAGMLNHYTPEIFAGLNPTITNNGIVTGSGPHMPWGSMSFGDTWNPGIGFVAPSHPYLQNLNVNPALPNDAAVSFDTGNAVRPSVIPGSEGLNVNSENVPISFDQNEIVCFGMVCGIAATYEQKGQENLPSSLLVTLKSSNRFQSDEYKTFSGRITNDDCHLTKALLEATSLSLYFTCVLGQQNGTKKKGKRFTSLPCSLDIVIYGPFELYGEVGNWLQENEVYLQDPDTCYMDSRYCNPHRMSSDDPNTCPMLSEVIERPLLLVPDVLPESFDFLDILSSHLDLEETPQPSSIRADLKRHQKQALTFMLNRERGWGLKLPDIWETVDAERGRIFINTVTRAPQPDEPPQFYGGIIADPMGLGKTLSMIALVATDLDAERTIDLRLETLQTDMKDIQDIGATLIIIPPPILGTWEKQIEDHVVKGSLIYRRHHGKTRLSGLDDLDTANLVLTTYHTVTADWKSDQGMRKSPLYSVRWKRIILDEAHYIRNGSSRMSAAVCSLEAVSRWAVTGTPIQNRLGDLSSLLKFIRVHPYTDPRRFEADISRLWKLGEDQEAVNRLKRLSACLLLRRPKTTIELPPRQDIVYKVDFSPEEREEYERIRQQAITRIDEALREEMGTRRSRGYVNVLQQIESLRLFSNMGLYYDSRHEQGSKQSSDSEDWSTIAQRTLNSQRELNPITCLQCTSALSLTEALLDDTNSKVGMAQYTSCLKFVCSECSDKLASLGQSLPCGHTPPCQSAQVSTSSDAMEEIDSSAPPQLRTASVSPPSKIRILIDSIKSAPPGTKCVVFSTWRLTLDLVKAALDHQCIQSLRFDGKVPQKDRQLVVEKFESDPQIQVMLLTLSCGAVGLTLTAASHAYLMEPHWNPTLEEQALARIHRLGQTKEVTTIRLCMRDSFEEQVVAVQESKKQLAGVLLSPHDSGHATNDIGNLARLRSLL